MLTHMQVAFYLPQLVQSLRSDHDGMMGATLLQKARENDMFAHQVSVADNLPINKEILKRIMSV